MRLRAVHVGFRAGGGVPAGAFGPGVAAAAATLTAARIGRRETVRIFSDLFGLQISPGALQKLLEQTSLTLEAPYTEILQALDTASVRGADETSWPQAGKGQWLSVSIAERMALFQIAKRRDRDAAKALLGEDPGGVIVTDRYAVYLFVDDARRQLCLAHLARDLIALGERDGAPGRLGRALSHEFGRVFTTLHAPGRVEKRWGSRSKMARVCPLSAELRKLGRLGTNLHGGPTYYSAFGRPLSRLTSAWEHHHEHRCSEAR